MYIKSKAENFDSFYFRDFLVEQADFLSIFWIILVEFTFSSMVLL